MLSNAFLYGNPVPYTSFIGRTKELRRIISRIVSHGECTALIGDPNIGKTSLLNYIVSNETRNNIFQRNAENLLFSQIDVHMLGSQFTPNHFWKYSLKPMKEQIVNKSMYSDIARHYDICRKNYFGNFTLETLFVALRKLGKRFVLLIDEFDALLYHPALNNAEFYGGLRSLASRSQGSFALVIASRTPLSDLNKLTQEFNPTGSPFFNIFSEVSLGPLMDKDLTKLFSFAGNKFTKHDKYDIHRLSGNHPYILQAACVFMCEAIEDGVLCRKQYVSKRLHKELKLFFNETWNIWSPEMRKAFTTIAIDNQTHLLEYKKCFSKKVFESLGKWGPELEDLNDKGMIAKDESFNCGYRVIPEIMLTWLADEIVKVSRATPPFETWLHEKGLDGAFLSIGEKNFFKKLIKHTSTVLGQGAISIIEGFGKGVGEGFGKKIIV